MPGYREINLYEYVRSDSFKNVHFTMRELAAHYNRLLDVAIECLDQDRSITYEVIDIPGDPDRTDRYEVTRYMWDTFELKVNGNVIRDLTAYEVLIMLYKQIPFIPTIHSEE
jgi:hypothetical protein